MRVYREKGGAGGVHRVVTKHIASHLGLSHGNPTAAAGPLELRYKAAHQTDNLGNKT